MKKTIITLFVGLALFPAVSFAQTVELSPASRAALIAELQAKLQELILQLVAKLNEQLTTIQSQNTQIQNTLNLTVLNQQQNTGTVVEQISRIPTEIVINAEPKNIYTGQTGSAVGCGLQNAEYVIGVKDQSGKLMDGIEIGIFTDELGRTLFTKTYEANNHFANINFIPFKRNIVENVTISAGNLTKVMSVKVTDVPTDADFIKRYAEGTGVQINESKCKN